MVRPVPVTKVDVGNVLVGTVTVKIADDVLVPTQFLATTTKSYDVAVNAALLKVVMYYVLVLGSSEPSYIGVVENEADEVSFIKS